jgi:drug/metabolite transporter (DMT)-like permease
LKNSISITSWAILLSLMIVWGSSFILIKKSLLYFDAVEVGVLRVTLTFVFLLPVAIKKALQIKKRLAIYMVISGFIGSLIPALMFALAQTQIDSSLAGTLNSLTPLFTLILGIVFFKVITRWYNILGVFIGLVGALGLIYFSSDQSFIFNLKYSFLVIIATICYAFNVNFIKFYLKDLNSITITVLTFFYIGIPSFLYVLFFSDIPAKIISSTEAIKGLGYLSILSIVGTGLALLAFNKLIKISSPIFASSVTYMIPIVAILWGIIDGEAFKFSYLIWFLMIIAGVLLVNAHPHRRMNIGSLLLFRKRKS